MQVKWESLLEEEIVTNVTATMEIKFQELQVRMTNLFTDFTEMFEKKAEVVAKEEDAYEEDALKPTTLGVEQEKAAMHMPHYAARIKLIDNN